jgi:hypothetical protein
MADTTHYGWGKPTVNASESTWGAEINAAFDKADADLRTVAGALAGSTAFDSSKTLAPGDRGVLQHHTTASTPTLTIPPQATVAWAGNVVIPGYCGNGAGAAVIAPGAGVTLAFAGATSAAGPRTASAGSRWQLERLAENLWLLSGVNVT